MATTLLLALGCAFMFIVVTTVGLRLHPVLALLAAAFLFGSIVGVPLANIAGLIGEGFGATIGAIGPLIILGGIIGTFLERSGAAGRLADALIGRIGSRRITIGMGGMGFVVSIPVFCDSGFILLSPLNHAAARKSNASLAPGAVALGLGLYATHTMVPPTPGPIAAAAMLEADLGLVLLIGIPVALVSTLAGIAYAQFHVGRTYIAPNELPASDNAASSGSPMAGPSILLAIAPIALPIALIIAAAVAKAPGTQPTTGAVFDALVFVGQPIIALAIGAIVALALPRQLSRAMLSEKGWVGDAIRDCAVIILITGAGGAFGKVLSVSGIGDTLGAAVSNSSLGLLLPLILAATIKTAQGSSTVAIITSAGLVAPLLPALGLESEAGRALATVAIGAGSMAVSHVNDSFFWVVGQLSNMTTRQALLLFSPGTALQAVVAGIALLLTAALIV